MTKSFGKICLLLAGTDISRADLREFGRWIERSGANRFVESIETLRELADDSGIGAPVPPSTPGRELAHGRELDLHSDVANKVERLLIYEAGLSRSVAAEKIRAELKKLSPSTGSIPELGRISFHNWVIKISNTIPPSLLLHLATKLRNEMIHSGNHSDWPLRRDK